MLINLKLALFILLRYAITVTAISSDNVNLVTCNENGGRMKNEFDWLDYLVLISMLIISCGIGIFYGFIGRKQMTSNDFLLGGSTMGTFPMAMSLAASFVTAIELLGNPAEMYIHGLQFWLICVAFLLVIPITSHLYLPVFMKLRLTSSYSYLALRFNDSVRYVAGALYILQMVLYTSVAVYAPALALSHVTGLNVYLAVTVVYVVCIFYASQGGMKAVIIADTFQAGILIASILLIVLLGEKFVGSTETIWSQNYRTNRLELFNFNPDPTIRHSFWSVTIGGTFYWMTMFCSNQASIQKYLSVESIGQVRKALWTSCFGLILIYTINFYTGMLMVAQYRQCDPIKSHLIENADELLPLYVINEMGQYRGLTGFFVAGIFAASLGTVASALNSLAAITINDFFMDLFKWKIPDSRGAIWSKWISIIYGLLSFVLVFIVAQLNGIMQVAISFNGMVGGVTLGLFSLGMFFPWANPKGALLGSLTAIGLISWMCLGQQIHMAQGHMDQPEKMVSIQNCSCINPLPTYKNLNNQNTEVISTFYRISYIWYSAIGFFVTVTVGMIVSLISGVENFANLDINLLSPPILKFFNGLPDNLKKVLGIPTNNKSINLHGITNKALEIDDEKKIDKIRKISAPC